MTQRQSNRRGRQDSEPRRSEQRRPREIKTGPRPATPAHGRWITGWNPVIEALRAGVAVERLWLAGGHHPRAKELNKLAARLGVTPETMDRRQLDQMVGGEEHQGAVALAPDFIYTSVDAMLKRAAAAEEAPFLLLLDHIEDPHNLGSLIRTAECAGVHGVIIPKRRAAQVTSAVGRASAGAVEHVPVAVVTNIVREMEELKKAGVWVVGAHMEGDHDLYGANLSGPTALVIGAEGRGLSRLVAERCDALVSIPMRGKVQSLNASVAGALLIYETVRARQ